MAAAEDNGPEPPEMVRRVVYDGIWPAGKPFPLTPLEACYVMRGWAVQPAGVDVDQVRATPGKIEGGEGTGLVWFWQS